ncbi:MAG: VWA domain-containing protein [Luteolibacter sp.]|uniref:vWA domain-containing protein n=1 Tax=Luteolibacter sp. TaxID=1962973 RepID=UPI0032641ACA
MSLFFQYPALLGLFALAGLPLLVHLLSRAKPPEYRFSNIDFLRRVIRRTARIRRPKDHLLLALRTLALIALAAAFVSPFLVSKDAPLPGEKSTVVIMIDRSASMVAREGAGSRFETACAQASRFLAEARPTAANLVWIDAEPDAAFPEPGPNLDFLTNLLNKAVPKPEPGALAAAFDLALRQLASVQGRRELIVLSDFQSSAWKDFQPALPPDIKPKTFRVATGAPPNLAVTRLLSQPTQPVAGQETTLLASVRNFSPDPVRTQLTLDADGSRQSQALDLPPWGETETAFILRPANPGPLPVTASIEADAFPGDDSRHSVIRVLDAIRISDSPPAAEVISKVIAALPWLEAIDTPGPGDIRVVSSWTDSKSLKADAESGITVLVHDSASVPEAALRELLAESAGNTPTLETSATGWQILPNEAHPAIQLFRSGDFGNPFSGNFRERLRLPASLAEIRLIASYSDGVPAIFEIPTGQAPILFFNLSLDPAKSDWPTQGGFLPAFAEIILRTRPNSAAGLPQALPGALLSKVSTDPAQGGAIKLIGPDGSAVETMESTTTDGMLLQSRVPAVPGIYRWEISGQAIDLTAINFPESESDLRPMESAPAFGNSAAPGESLARQAALSRGIPLWPWLALSAISCLLVESFVNLRSNRPVSA